MPDTVPASTRIRYKRVANIDTDRLRRRYAYLKANKADMAKGCDARIEMRVIAREFLTIEAELARRAEAAKTYLFGEVIDYGPIVARELGMTADEAHRLGFTKESK